jgi:hypothetical protein
MKIYEPQPENLVRLQIAKIGEETQYLTLCETTVAEVKELCEKLIIAQNISPFTQGKRTSINIREAKGGKNGKSISISFYGLSTKEVLNLIIQHLKK